MVYGYFACQSDGNDVVLYEGDAVRRREATDREAGSKKFSGLHSRGKKKGGASPSLTSLLPRTREDSM